MKESPLKGLWSKFERGVERIADEIRPDVTKPQREAAIVLFGEGRFVQAVEQLTTLLQEAPHDAEAWFWLGKAHREMTLVAAPQADSSEPVHSLNLAISAFHRAVELSPDYSEAWLELARTTHLSLGGPNEPIFLAAIRTARSRATKAAIFRELALTHERCGSDPALVIWALGKALEYDRDTLSDAALLAEHYLPRDLRAAGNWAERALAKGQDVERAWLVLARCAISESRFDLAQSRLGNITTEAFANAKSALLAEIAELQKSHQAVDSGAAGKIEKVGDNYEARTVDPLPQASGLSSSTEQSGLATSTRPQTDRQAKATSVPDLAVEVVRVLSQAEQAGSMSSSAVTKLAQLRRDVAQVLERIGAPFRVCLVGEFSAGKSSLLNALVGQEVSAVGVTPTTERSLLVCYGSEQRSWTTWWQDFEISTLELPLPALQSMQWADTPGSNAGSESRLAAFDRALAMACDLAVWVFSAQQVGKKSEKQRLKKLLAHGLPVVAVVAKSDQVTGEELKELTSHTRSEFPELVDVLPVSATKAQDGAYKLAWSKFVAALTAAAETRSASRDKAIRHRLHEVLRDAIAVIQDVQNQSDLALRAIKTVRDADQGSVTTQNSLEEWLQKNLVIAFAEQVRLFAEEHVTKLQLGSFDGADEEFWVASMVLRLNQVGTNAIAQLPMLVDRPAPSFVHEVFSEVVAYAHGMWRQNLARVMRERILGSSLELDEVYRHLWSTCPDIAALMADKLWPRWRSYSFEMRREQSAALAKLEDDTKRWEDWAGQLAVLRSDLHALV